MREEDGSIKWGFLSAGSSCKALKRKRDMAEQRKVVVVTSLGKIYRGMVDVPNESYRTTDLFNSPSIFWKNPAEKCFDNAIGWNDICYLILHLK